MTLTIGGIAALALIIAFALLKKGLAKTAASRLMLLVGVLGLGGALGAIVARIARSGVNGATNATDRLFGAGIGGLAVVAVLSIFIWPHVKPRKPQPATNATPFLALAWGTFALATGGVFAQAAGFSGNLAATGLSYLNDGITAFIQGF